MRASNFVWVVYEDGDWTPISLPWLTVTLMDFDCGSRRSECERVTSAEHSHYEAGSEVRCPCGKDPTLCSRTQ